MKKVLTPEQELDLIRGKLKHFKLDFVPKHYLDTGSKRLNSVLGVRKKGIPSGKIIEISGPESNGKSALALDLVAIAQAAGWSAIWFDAEHSLDKVWAVKRGVEWDSLSIVEPYEGYFDKAPKLNKEGKPVNPPTRSSAEQLCDEVERLIRYKHHKKPERPIILVTDSITALTTALELEQSIAEGNMPSKMSLPQFMSRLLRRWVGEFQINNTVGIFINQLRVDPMKRFGNPETTPGGKALRFYSHIRVRVGRAGETKSKMITSGKQIGIKSIIKNKKNKVGGLEYSECGYKMFFDGSSRFVDPSEFKGAGSDD